MVGENHRELFADRLRSLRNVEGFSIEEASCFRQLDLAPFDLLFWPHPLVNHHSAPGRSEALRRP